MIGHPDQECVDLFRKGAPLKGTLKCSGNGTPVPAKVHIERCVGTVPACIPASGCQAAKKMPKKGELSVLERNKELLLSLKEDKNSDISLKKAEEDFKKHRMAMPRPLLAEDIMQRALSPRFCIEQGKLIDARLPVAH